MTEILHFRFLRRFDFEQNSPFDSLANAKFRFQISEKEKPRKKSFLLFFSTKRTLKASRRLNSNFAFSIRTSRGTSSIEDRITWQSKINKCWKRKKFDVENKIYRSDAPKLILIVNLSLIRKCSSLQIGLRVKAFRWENNRLNVKENFSSTRTFSFDQNFLRYKTSFFYFNNRSS